MFDVYRAFAAYTGAIALLITGPSQLRGQTDTNRVHRDSVPPPPQDTTHRTHVPAVLKPVTVTTTPVQHTEPLTVVTVGPQQLATLTANSPIEILRETAG